MKLNRREFISTLAASTVTMPLLSKTDLHFLTLPEDNYPVRLFSKPLDSYDFDFMCECLVKSGIKGFDLTVREGGKAEPSHVESVLPRLKEEADKFNLAIDMMVTGILSAKDQYAERVLKTASSMGIKYYRLGWFDYDQKIQIRQTIQRDRLMLREVAELNRKYKITAGYQNHTGVRVGAPVWDLDELLRDLSPDILGCQYDVRHAMVEGANTWILGMRLIAKHINSFAIKDFIWKNLESKPQAVTVPLGEGMVDWDLFFSTVKELNMTGPITLHIEYPLLAPGEEKLSLIQQQEIIVKKLRKDVSFLKGYMDKYQLV